MMHSEVVFTLLYLLLSVCIVYPPIEFMSAGLTIPAMFSSVLGSEELQFVRYNIKRATLTIFIYSLLPIGYLLGLVTFGFSEEISLFELANDSLFWRVYLTISIVIPLGVLCYIKNWSRNDWSQHPIVLHILKFGNNNSDWQSIAQDIDREYRRVDKICIQTNAVCKVVATENWVIKVLPHTMYVVHQSDASLVVNQADTHHISYQNADAQFINIEVKSSRLNVAPFTIRINALDFKDLQDRVARTITVLPEVKFHKTLVDQFIDAFKEVIQDNPRILTNQQLDQCIGCFQNPPNVKILRQCAAEESAEACGICYCRPLWCIECLARWFASRQESDVPNTWLSSKCTCPLCRAKFCILDVCMIDTESDDN